MTEKKATDYTNSAENLCNPLTVGNLLNELHLEEGYKATLEDKLKERCAKLVNGIAERGATIAELQKQIREAIETHGSYQDIPRGHYAVKYRRISKTYNAEKFAGFFEKFVPAVIIQVVNEAALEGLIKGGLIKEEELENCDVIQKETKYAFIIR